MFSLNWLLLQLFGWMSQFSVRTWLVVVLLRTSVKYLQLHRCRICPWKQFLKADVFELALKKCLWRSSFFSTVAGFRLKDGLLLTLASIVTIALTLFKPQSQQINVQVKNKDISTVLMTGLKCTEDTRTNSVTSPKCC